MLPKNNTKTASAASVTVSPEIVVNMAKAKYGSKSTSYTSITYSGLNGASTLATVNSTNDSITTEEVDVSLQAKVIYVPFNIKINVPAKTQYTVKFSFSMSVYRGGLITGTTTVSVAYGFLYYFADGGTISTVNVSKPNALAAATTSDQAAQGYDPATVLCEQEVVFTNKSNTAQDITAVDSFGLLSCSEVSNSQKHQERIELSITDSTIEQVKVLAPVTTGEATSYEEDYTGSPITFYSYYNSDFVAPTEVVGTDIDNDRIDDISLSDIDPATGVFKPTQAGTYTITYSINTDGVTWVDGGTGTKTLTFTINPATVTEPTLTPTSQQYTGSPLPFSLVNFNNGKDIITEGVTPTNAANSVTAANGGEITDTTGSFLATSVDTYTVTLALRDSKNHVWKNDGTNNKLTLNFEVTKKELTFTFTCSSTKAGKAVWESGASATITVTDNRISGDNLTLVFYYDDIGHSLTEGNTTGSETTISMPTDIATGSHTLYVILDGTTGDNANYKLSASNSYNFEVTAASLGTDFDWIYSENGTDIDYITDGTELTYKLNTTYSVKIDIPSSQQSYISIVGSYTNASGSTVDTYNTSVTLKSTGNPFPDGNGGQSDTITLTLSWSIVKADFDLSGVKWVYEYIDANGTKQTGEYSSALEYNDGRGITLSINASTLPQGLTLTSDYAGDKQTKVGKYSVTVMNAFFEYDHDCYNELDDLTFDWEIKTKNLFSQWTTNKVSFSNDNGNGSFIAMIVKSATANAADYIEYKYYDTQNGNAVVTLDDIKAAASLTEEKNYKVEAYVKADYADRYEVLNGGAVPTTTFKTGSNNELATATVDGNDGSTAITVEYDGKGHFGEETLKVTGSDEQIITDFSWVYYKGNSPVEGNELDGLPTDAGTYVIMFALGDTVSGDYILTSEWIVVTITPKKIPVPTLGEIVFSNQFVNLADCLGGSYLEYKNIITLGGTYDGVKNVSSSYKATLTITDSNYCWDYSGLTTVKWLVGYSLADNEFKEVSDTVCELSWGITPYVLKTSSWNLSGKEGAAYNIPANLIDGLEVTINYQYYTDKVSNPLAEGESLVAGSTYFVKAELLGADANNFVFEDSKATTSDFVTYKVPKSGMAAFMGTMRDFFTRTVLNLPVWLWFVIALAVLLFLIIIIAVAKKRSKNKEERLAKKEAKEEEKRRREEERQMQREKLEAERELAKAKQEAELEKIRAQAGLGMAGMGAASMAMAQQPMQQQMPAQQQMPSMGAAQMSVPQQQYVQQQPQVQYVQQPMQMPMAMPQQMPMPQTGGGSDMLALMQAQLAEMRAEQNSAIKTELEIMKLRMEQKQQPQQYAQGNNGQNGFAPDGDMEKIGALAVAIWRNMQAQQNAEAKPAPAEEVEKTYPDNAVITTTTTVDTTKNKSVARSREEDSNFDVDGFYDKYE